MFVFQPFRIAFMLLILSFVIFFHELGHFASCKVFSIRTPVFSIGFGPPLIQKKIGDTQFRISLLPFGGYVSMNAHDLEQLSYWQKMIITLAGIFNNFLLSWLLFLLLFLLNPIKNIPVGHYALRHLKIENAGFAQAIKHATLTLFSMIKRSFYYITTLARTKTRQQIHPIAQLMKENIQGRFSALLIFVATISIELGVFNVLPIPMLDGGQAMNYTLHAITKTLLPGYSQILIHFLYILLFIGLLLFLNARAGKQNS